MVSVVVLTLLNCHLSVNSVLSDHIYTAHFAVTVDVLSELKREELQRRISDFAITAVPKTRPVNYSIEFGRVQDV